MTDKDRYHVLIASYLEPQHVERIRQVEVHGLLKLKMAMPPAEDFGRVGPSKRARPPRAQSAAAALALAQAEEKSHA